MAGDHGGSVVAVLGLLTSPDLEALAAARRSGSRALALVAEVASFATPGTLPSPEACTEHERCLDSLRATGWVVARVAATDDLAGAWATLHRAGVAA